METPITERTNPSTKAIGSKDAKGVIHLLHQCDMEIFEGWQQYPCIFSGEILKKLNKIANVAARLLEDPWNNAIVLGGAGASGGLAFAVTRAFNELLDSQKSPRCYEYAIAGGDKLLIPQDEDVDVEEDRAESGARVLDRLTMGKTRVLYIGISCGMSALWVAGQLNYCLKNADKFIPVLITFNPIEVACANSNGFSTIVPKLLNLSNVDQAFILDPIVGPEAVMGSTRLKGGTATKILLDAIFLRAHQLKAKELGPSIVEMLMTYQSLCELTYEKYSDIASLAKAAAASLKKGGRIYYLGAGGLGVMGLLDASECGKTYGTEAEKFRCFIQGGYKALKNRSGDLSGEDSLFEISYSKFKNDYRSELQPQDFVVILTKDGDIEPFDHVFSSLAEIGILNVMTSETHRVKLLMAARCCALVQIHIHVDENYGQTALEKSGIFTKLQTDIVAKLVCNCTSTGAHILAGKVYKNYMVDFRLSQSKLFHRAKRLIKILAECTLEQAEEFLIRTIYDVDEIEPKLRNQPLANHLQLAFQKKSVVPVALIQAIIGCSVRDAKHKLAEAENDVKTAIKLSLDHKKKPKSLLD